MIPWRQWYSSERGKGSESGIRNSRKKAAAEEARELNERSGR